MYECSCRAVILNADSLVFTVIESKASPFLGLNRHQKAPTAQKQKIAAIILFVTLISFFQRQREVSV